jgi:predicted protein tyrosine phosphatase
VLEHIGSAEAQEVLQVLVKTTPNLRVVDAAAAALLRIGKRGPKTR